MPKIESEKIDCLHRPCSRPAPRGKVESVRTHSEVIEQFDSFSLLKLFFLVRNWHCWSRKAFPRQMTLKAEKKKLWKRRFFDTADRHEKLYGRSRLYASAQGRHETGGVLSLFSSRSFDISIKKQRAEAIFRLSRPVSCKIRKMAQGSNDLSTLPLRSCTHYMKRGRKSSFDRRRPSLFWKKIRPETSDGFENLAGIFLKHLRIVQTQKRGLKGTNKKFPLQKLLLLFTSIFDLKIPITARFSIYQEMWTLAYILSCAERHFTQRKQLKIA